MIIYTIQDNTDRARKAVLLLWASAFLLALFTLLSLLFPTDDEGTVDTPMALAQGILAIALLGLLIGTTVCFLRWFRRAYTNLKRGGRRIAHSDGWAVGAWFVPILNVFRPYTIMKEVWDGTHQLAYNQQPSHKLVVWWWTAFVFSSIMGRTVNNSSRHAETVQQLETASIFDAIHTIFVILFIALTIACIKRIAVAEEQLLLRQQVDAIGGPAPEPQNYYPDEETLAY